MRLFEFNFSGTFLYYIRPASMFRRTAFFCALVHGIERFDYNLHHHSFIHTLSSSQTYFQNSTAILFDAFRLPAPVRSRNGPFARWIVPVQQHTAVSAIRWPSGNRRGGRGNGETDATAAMRTTGCWRYDRFYGEQSFWYSGTETLETILDTGLQVGSQRTEMEVSVWKYTLCDIYKEFVNWHTDGIDI